ncbi:DNA cytosine methyltransferase [Microcoleus sp. Pol17_C1]|uniref:DNA cytosine methyltransferase n=1 Tax=unclassified Microcoleus TaxID=2642155 RepID=UPI002FCF3CE3
MKLKCVDLFAGIGAWKLAGSLVNSNSQIKFETIEFVENNPYSQQVLKTHFPEIPIHSDIQDYLPVKGQADVYTISFPCTGTSRAGKKTGLAHIESSLWFEALRCIIIGRPSFVVLEQPAGVIDRGLRTIIAGFRLADYQTEIEVVSASECGAPHERQRVFVVAYRNDLQLQQRQGWTCWSDNIGKYITIAKSFISYPKTESRTLPLVNGVPSYLAGVHYDHWWRMNPPPVSPGLKRRTPGRREAVTLAGLSICVPQATVPLMRLQFLASLLPQD